MERDQMEARQFYPLLFGALLAPVTQLLPAWTAPAGGALGWASGLTALPGALVFAALMGAVCALDRRRPGYFGALRMAWGRGGGSMIALAYLAWGVMLLGMNVRLYALRFLSTGYRNAPQYLFIIVLLALSWWLARGSAGRFGRAGQIFYLALTGTLWAALVFALPHGDLKNLVPVGGAELWGAAKGGGVVLSVLSSMVFAGFLAAKVRREEGTFRRALSWAARFCLVVCALQLVCLAAFGAELTARMDAPLFMLIKGVGVQGGFEHIESVIIAVWSLSDLLLAAMLTIACRGIGEELLPAAVGKYAVTMVAAAGGAAALFLFPDAFALKQWAAAAPVVGAVMGFLVPGLTLAVGRLRAGKQKGGISCG